jgi:hypothetical protein
MKRPIKDKELVNKIKRDFFILLGDRCFKIFCLDNDLNYENMYYAVYRSQIANVEIFNLLIKKLGYEKEFKVSAELVDLPTKIVEV